MAAADHLLDQPCLVDAGGVGRVDALAVAENRHAVRDGEHVVEKVGDEDEALARALEAAKHGKETLDLRRRERRGGLVEDDDACPGEKHPAELDQLLQAERQGSDARAGVDIDAEALEMLAGDARHLAPAHDAHAVRRLEAEKHVLGDRELGADRQLLVHHADARVARVARRAEVHRPAVEAHGALIFGVHACDDLHQRALAGTILADEAMHLALAQGEVDALEGDDSAERLGDARQLEQRLDASGHLLHLR